MAITGKIDEKAQTITLILPLQKPEPSKSGKNMLIASTGGNRPVEGCTYKGQPVVLGAFVYYKPEEK